MEYKNVKKHIEGGLNDSLSHSNNSYTTTKLHKSRSGYQLTSSSKYTKTQKPPIT